MLIESLGKEITIAEKTRLMSRLVNEELMKGVNVSGTDGKMDFPAVNIDHSEELLVRLMTGLTQAEIDSLKDSEYLAIKEEINKKK